MSVRAPCPACDLEDCRAVYARVLAAEYADPERWPVHALTVSAYAAQHPGSPSMRAARDVGTHLVTLALVVERGLPTERAARVRKAAVERISEGMTWLTPPSTESTGTVAAVAAAPDAESHCRRVWSWAEEVWGSWASHHDTIRRWIDWLVAASPPDFTESLPRPTPVPSSNGRSNGAA